MVKVFCRYMQCNMSFSTENHRKQHEGTMHKDMLKDAAVLLLDKIFNSNSEESLNKKVLKIPSGRISYKEARNKIEEQTEDSKSVLKVLENIVENYFVQYPDHGMEQMMRVSEFKIR